MKRLLHRLLRLFPASFRDQYGEEMLEFLALRTRDIRRRQGWLGVLRIWIVNAFDISRVVLVERWEGTRRAVHRTGTFRSFVADSWRDVLYAARSLRRDAAFTAAVVLTLALGIGGTSVIFSLVNAVLLRPPPYEDHDRVVGIWERCKHCSGDAPVPAGDFSDWKAESQSFTHMAAISTSRSFNIGGVDRPERVSGVAASAGFFEALGVLPSLGRPFRPQDDHFGAGNVAILSDDLWRRQFGASPEVINKPIRINAETYTVVGIMPPGFAFPRQSEMPSTVRRWFDKMPDLWVPLALSSEEAQDRSVRRFAVIARLREGVTLEQAQAELRVIDRNIAAEYPDEAAEGHAVAVVAIREQIVRDIRPVLLLLLGAVGFVLLIACANVASLLGIRGVRRRRELAVRRALGASRGRVVRQLLAESVFLAWLGGGLGLVLAGVGVDVVSLLSSSSIIRGRDIGLDVRVVGFTLSVAVMTGIGFGLIPALRSSRANVHEASQGGARGGGVPTQRLFGHFVVVGQLALAVVLLVATGLTLKSLIRLHQVDVGINTDQMLTMNLTLPAAKYPDDNAIRAFYTELFDRVAALSQVQHVGAIARVPLTGHWGIGWFTLGTPRSFERAGQPVQRSGPLRPGDQACCASYQVVGGAVFKALGVALQRGRAFTEQDREGASAVAIINEQLARRFFPNEDPVGKQLGVWTDIDAFAISPVRRIVGVVGDIKQADLSEEVMPQIFLPQSQVPWRSLSLVARGTADPAALTVAIRREVRALDAELPIADIATMRTIIARSVADPRFYVVVLGAFGMVALVLAALGAYGVISYLVNERAKEMGIRIALGARAVDIIKLILGTGILVTVLGLGLGLSLALALTRFLAAMLFEVAPTDPATFAGVSVVLFLSAVVALYFPARRATKLDPVTSLRLD